MNERTKVVIADDHPPTRLGVRTVLEEYGFEVTAEVGDAAGAIRAAEQHHPDVCLVDIDMPGNGIRATGQIKSKVPETTVVMLTVSRDDDDLFDALRAGASGYLLKDMDPDRLPQALRGVLAGEAALPRGLVARVIGEFQRRDPTVHLRPGSGRAARLTSREMEVLSLMRDGLSTADIARRLFVSKGTVRTHVASILKKLRVPDREAAVQALEEDPRKN